LADSRETTASPAQNKVFEKETYMKNLIYFAFAGTGFCLFCFSLAIGSPWMLTIYSLFALSVGVGGIVKYLISNI